MPVGPVINGPVRRLVADVDVDTIAFAPEPAVIGPVIFNVTAPAKLIPAAALDPFTLPVIFRLKAAFVDEARPTLFAPLILPDILTVAADVTFTPTEAAVRVDVAEPPDTEPVIVNVVPPKLMPYWFAFVVDIPPVILPTTVKLPAV